MHMQHSHAHTHIKLLQTANHNFVVFSIVQQSNSSACNRGITETEAVQLENINSTNGGGTLPYTPQ